MYRYTLQHTSMFMRNTYTFVCEYVKVQLKQNKNKNETKHSHNVLTIDITFITLVETMNY